MPGMNILCVFNDPAFENEGYTALRKMGYVVTPADCAVEAERDFTNENYQVVVIGPGLVRTAKEQLAIKAWEQGCAVIVVCSDNDDYKIRADAHVAAKESGNTLARTVDEAITAKYYAVAV